MIVSDLGKGSDLGKISSSVRLPAKTLSLTTTQQSVGVNLLPLGNISRIKFLIIMLVNFSLPM